MTVQAAVAYLNGSAMVDHSNQTTAAARQELYRARNDDNGDSTLFNKFDQHKDTMVNVPTHPAIFPTTQPFAQNTVMDDHLHSLRTLSPAGDTLQVTSKTNTFRASSRNSLDTIEHDLVALYQEAMGQQMGHQPEAKAPENEASSSDATKIRDYQIRVAYLVQKVEQLSEERDNLERELNIYRRKHGTIDTPVSLVFDRRLSDIFNDEEEHVVTNEKGGNDKVMRDILDAYEEANGGETASEMSISSNERYENQIAFLLQQLETHDRGTKLAIQQYITDLEKERLQVKALKQVIQKQDELIAKMEGTTLSESGEQRSRSSVTKCASNAVRPPRPATPARATAPQRRSSAYSSVPRGYSAVWDKNILQDTAVDAQRERQRESQQRQQRSDSVDFLDDYTRPDSVMDSFPRPSSHLPFPSVPKRPTPSPSVQHALNSRRESAASSVASWSTRQEDSDDYEAIYARNSGDYGAMYSNYMESEDSIAQEHHREALRKLENASSKTATTNQQAYPAWHEWQSKLSSQ